MRRFLGSLLLALAAMAPVTAAAQVAIILDFESFPGPDGRFGTADDVPAPICGSGVCARLGTEFASAGIVFVSGTLSHFPLDPARPGNHFVSSTPPDVRLSVPCTACR